MSKFQSRPAYIFLSYDSILPQYRLGKLHRLQEKPTPLSIVGAYLGTHLGTHRSLLLLRSRGFMGAPDYSLMMPRDASLPVVFYCFANIIVVPY